jgi:hypothetical protein
VLGNQVTKKKIHSFDPSVCVLTVDASLVLTLERTTGETDKRVTESGRTKIMLLTLD